MNIYMQYAIMLLCTAVLCVSDFWGLSRGKVLHISRCVCTTIHNAHLQVLFSLGVSWNEEGYSATVFDNYNSLLQLYISIITIP